MFNYYLAVQKNQDDYKTGMLPAILCPEFVPNVEKTEYGIYPWYAMPKRKGQAFPPFPQTGLHLILTDKKYKFDIKRVSKFYAFSSKFYNCLQTLKTTLEEIAPVKLTDKNGILLSDSDYYVGRFKKLPFNESIDIEKSTYADYGYLNDKKISEIFITPKLEYDIFFIDGLTPSQTTLVCNEEAILRIKNHDIKGIDFIRTDEANWPLPDTSQLSPEEYSTYESSRLMLV